MSSGKLLATCWLACICGAMNPVIANTPEPGVVGTKAISDADAFCLRSGILNGYRCDANSESAQIEAGVRYSIQLLSSNNTLPPIPPALPEYHRTVLSPERSFVYFGAFDDRQQALDMMTALVMTEQLDVDRWRPALVQVDKSREVPAVRLVQMYRSLSFSHLSVEGEIEQADRESGTEMAQGLYYPSYYTVQVASFELLSGRNAFASEARFVEPMCRTRRNGRHTVYSGVFEREEEAKVRLRDIRKNYARAYVLRLKQEDMFSCNDKNERLVYSHPDSTPPAIARAAAKQMPRYFTVQLASFKNEASRQRYVSRHSSLDLMCRTRRNGLLVVYTGVFGERSDVKNEIKRLARKGVSGYLLKLEHEDMHSCSDSQQVLVYSRPGSRPPKPHFNNDAVSRNKDELYVDGGVQKKKGSASAASRPKRISGLAKLAELSLADTSISSALGLHAASVSSSRGHVVQLDVLAPELHSDRSSSVLEEFEERPLKASESIVDPIPEPQAQSVQEQDRQGLARSESASEVALVLTRDVSSGEAETVASSGSQEEGVGRLANDWQPASSQVFYTIQLATFKGPKNEARFVRQHRTLEPLCRVRSNGQLAVYSGKFSAYGAAKDYLSTLPQPIDGYVVKLRGELLPPCGG